MNFISFLSSRWKAFSFYAKVLAVATGLLGFALGWIYGRAHTPEIHPIPAPVYANGITLVPESERPLGFCVIGVEGCELSTCYLPQLQKTASMPESSFQEIRRQWFWLNFEMSHGRILNALPPETQVYVALPDPEKVNDADGSEEKFFLDYLKTRCGWAEGQISKRIHFFKSPTPLVWAEDIGKILGRDNQGRWVIYRGSNDIAAYRQAIEDLCRDYPDQFAFRDLPQGISAEGGDEDLVRTPEGQLSFLVGRHRARKYLEWAGGHSLSGESVSQDKLAKAQGMFSSAFDGVPAFFIPSQPLKNPSLGNDNLFHLDMSVAVLSFLGSPKAFVPSYVDRPIDRVSGEPLDPDFVHSLQEEYDLIASDLSNAGYKVDRLALDDHPVRSPANMVKFYDPASGRCTVFLAKYPYHMVEPGQSSPQKKFKDGLEDLKQKGEAWQQKPDETNFKALHQSLESFWATMDEVSASPNPLFEKNRELLQKAGIEVVAVPDYAWGSGGLHCQLLH